MKLSEVLETYLLTSVSEGTFLVYWADLSDKDDRSLLRLVYSDPIELTEYEGEFEDQEVTWTRGNEFVVSCDGQPWTFAAWQPANH